MILTRPDAKDLEKDTPVKIERNRSIHGEKPPFDFHSRPTNGHRSFGRRNDSKQDDHGGDGHLDFL